MNYSTKKVSGSFNHRSDKKDKGSREDTRGYTKSDGASSSVDPPLLQQPKTRNSKDHKPTDEEDMMATGGGPKKKNPDSTEIPEKWQHYLYNNDPQQVLRDSEKFFAMKIAYKDYRDQIKEFIIALKSDCETVTDSEKKFPLLFEYPDLEEDAYFENYGKKHNNFENKYKEVLLLHDNAIDRLLQHCIEECTRYKSEIVALRKELGRLQGERSPPAQGPCTKDTNLKQQVLPEQIMQRYRDVIDQWKGLQVVQKILEEQSATLSDANIVGQPSEEEKVAERLELAKPYAPLFQDSIPDMWRYSAESAALERICTEVEQDCEHRFSAIKKTVTEINEKRKHRQMIDKHSTPAEAVVEDEVIRTESNEYWRYEWKVNGLHQIIGNLTHDKEFMEKNRLLTVTSKDEQCFENEEYVIRRGQSQHYEKMSIQKILKLQHPIRNYEELKRMKHSLIEVCTKQMDVIRSLVADMSELRIRIKSEKYEEVTECLTAVVNEKNEMKKNFKEHVDVLMAENRRQIEVIKTYQEEKRKLTEEKETLTMLEDQLQSLRSTSARQRKKLEEKLQLNKTKYDALMKENRTNSEKLMKCHADERKKWADERKMLIKSSSDLERQKKDMDKKLEKQKQDTDEECRLWAEKDNYTMMRLSEMHSECEHFKEQFKQSSQMNELYKQKLQQYEQHFQYQNEQIEKINHAYMESQQFIQDQKMDTQRKVQSLEAEKEKLLTRLSKIAGAKLTQGNAAITDLSDPDRPMKIAEKYSELYDNEWTDALEELLDKGADDAKGINILMQIVTGAYEFCCEMSQKYQERMIQSATCLPIQSSLSVESYETNQSSNTREPLHTVESADSSQSQDSSQSDESQRPQGHKGIELTEEQKQNLHELRKALCPRLLPLVEQHHHIMLEEILMKEFGKGKVIRQNLIEVESLTQDKTSQSIGSSSPPANLQEVFSEVKIDEQASTLEFNDNGNLLDDGGENKDVSGESLRRPKLEEQQQADELGNQKQSAGESNRDEIQEHQQTYGELNNTLEDGFSKESLLQENRIKNSGMKQPGGAKSIICSEDFKEKQSSVNEDDAEKVQDTIQKDLTIEENPCNLHHEFDSNSLQKEDGNMHECMSAHYDEKNTKESPQKQETQQNDMEEKEVDMKNQKEKTDENLGNLYLSADSNNILKEFGNMNACLNAHDDGENMKESSQKQETQQNEKEEMEVDIKNQQDKTRDETVISDGSKTLENTNGLPVENCQHKDMETDPVIVISSATHECVNGKDYSQIPEQSRAINVIETADNLSPKTDQRNEITKKSEIVEVVLEDEFLKTKAFAKKCANLTWFMRIKDPPLHMVYNLDYGSPMEIESFKHYTQSGKLVKFIVWPALFLHESGPLLAKGVAQPMNKAETRAYKEKYGDSS